MSFALLTFGFAACSSSEEFPETPQNGPKQAHKISVSMNKKSATRTVLSDSEGDKSEWLWEEGDQLVLTDASGNCVTTLTLTEGIGNNLAKFYGECEQEVFVGPKYRLTYLGRDNSASFEEGDTNLSFNVDFSNQDGTPEGLGTCDVMSEEVTFLKNKQDEYYNEQPNLELKKIFSVVHFEFDENTDQAGTATKTELCGIGDGGIYQSVTVSLGAGGLSYDLAKATPATKSNPLVLNLDKNDSGFEASDIYVTMVPGKNITPVFKRTYGDETVTVAYGTPGKAKELVKSYLYRNEKNAKAGIIVPMEYSSYNEILFNFVDVDVDVWGSTSYNWTLE